MAPEQHWDWNVIAPLMCVQHFGPIHWGILESSWHQKKVRIHMSERKTDLKTLHKTRSSPLPPIYFLIPSSLSHFVEPTVWPADKQTALPTDGSANVLLIPFSLSFFPLRTVTPSLHLPVTHSWRQFWSERIGSCKHALTSHQAFKEQTSRSNPTFPGMLCLRRDFQLTHDNKALH